MVLKHEGGFSDHKEDPGGPTNLGITLANFRLYVKPNGTVADLKKLTKEQAATCYRRQYWDAVAGSELPDGIDLCVFDFAVNSGPSRAAKYLQSVVGAPQDGRVGPATLAAVRAKMLATVIHDLCDKRMAFLKGLKTWKTFGKGWSRRVTDVRSEALKMAAPQSTTSKPIETSVSSPKTEAQSTAPAKVNWLVKLLQALAALFKRK